MVRLLLETKANVSETNEEGETLLHVALVSQLQRLTAAAATAHPLAG